MRNKGEVIVLLGAGFSTGNMGVCALASGAIASALESYPNAKLYFLDYETKPATYRIRHYDKDVAVGLMNIRFSKNVFFRNNIVRLIITAMLLKLIPFQKLRLKLARTNPWLGLLSKSQIVGAISGGDSFSDIYGLTRLIYVSLPQVLVLLLKKNLVLLPQTIGPFGSIAAKGIARYILRRAKEIYSRDRQGQEVASRIIRNGNKKASLCYDMGFLMHPQISCDRMPAWLTSGDRSLLVVGLNVSGLLYMGGYTANNMFGLRTDYRKIIDQLVNNFVRKHGAELVLIPHVWGSDGESDVSACNQVYSKADQDVRKHIHVIDQDYDHHEVKAIIGWCDFFLGSRMHACIAALSQSVPAIGLAYSQKFCGVFESVNMAELTIDLREYDEASLLDRVLQIYERRQEFRARLDAEMPLVKASVMKLFKDVISMHC